MSLMEDWNEKVIECLRRLKLVHKAAAGGVIAVRHNDETFAIASAKGKAFSVSIRVFVNITQGDVPALVNEALSICSEREDFDDFFAQSLQFPEVAPVRGRAAFTVMYFVTRDEDVAVLLNGEELMTLIQKLSVFASCIVSASRLMEIKKEVEGTE